jgi:hypothetical protein
LAEVDPLACAPKASVVSDGDEGLEELDVEHFAHARNIARSNVFDQINSLFSRCANRYAPLTDLQRSISMITAIVRFRLPEGTTLAAAKSMFEKSVPNYTAAPGLVRKYYLFGEDRVGGGVYLWENRDAADKQYSAAWKNMIADKFGNAPEITYYDTPVIVDNSPR